MGIYDRGYYRDEAASAGGASRYRFRGLSAWSVTTWLIIINCAVFAFDAFMGKAGLPVQSYVRYDATVLPPKPEEEKTYRLLDGPAARQAAPAEAVRTVGVRLFRYKLDPNGVPIGEAIYEVRPPLEALGHFSTGLGFGRLEVWRLVTFQFLHDHASIWHLAMNMLGLYMFGVLVEEQLGRRKYLAFYLVCGIFGGLTYLLLNLLGWGLHIRLPGVLFTDPHTPLIGASAGVFGVIMACARIAPNMPVYIMFLPIALRMRWVAYGWLALSVFNLVAAGHNAGGDAAHVGGALAGAYFIRHSHLLLDFFDVFGDSRKGRRPGRAPRKPRDPRPPREPPRDEARIDAILDKIREHGIQSLSEREKRLLQQDTERRRRGEGG